MLEFKKAELIYIEQFLNNAGNALETFRYFSKRPIDIINNHKLTLLLFLNDEPIGYGHLEEENSEFWLGIAIIELKTGLGYGELMLEQLVKYAFENKISKINLTVDKDNLKAISLYEKFGFIKILSINEKTIQMIKEFSQLEIYVSTLAFNKKNCEEIIDLASKYNLSIEFSSGLPYKNDMDLVYRNAKIKKIIHNYFPAPQIPFVLNLASDNEEIRKKSIEHCLKGIKLTKFASSNFFAAHAGFCLDPKPYELGNKLSITKNIDKEKHIQLFLDSLNIITEFSRQNGCTFLIENNVISKFNLSELNVNPLLCCTGDEIVEIAKRFDSSNFGILLDTAHFKVSCNTLNLNIDAELYKISPYIKSIHHSDNNGLIDSNEKIDENYWFLKYMKDYTKLPHVIEVKNINIKEIFNQINLIEKHEY